MRFRDHGIRRTRGGQYAVRLGAHERDLLASLPAQVTAAIKAEDPSTRRLFPPAHADDPAAEAEYRELVRDGLLDGKLEALRVFEETAQNETLDEPQLLSWLGALESIRLVLGTALDIREDAYAGPIDESDPDAPRVALYGWLSWLQEETVAALAAGL